MELELSPSVDDLADIQMYLDTCDELPPNIVKKSHPVLLIPDYKYESI